MTDKSTEDTEEKPPPEFAAFLLSQGKGSSHDDLSRRLQELVLAVQETGKQGKLSYTITIKPVGTKKSDSNSMVTVIDEIKSALPKQARPESVFFLDDQGGLSRNPVNQPTLYDEVTEGKPAR